ncbi:MAG: hypothetical protein V1734_05135 [Nanoarchaeota archaeon]
MAKTGEAYGFLKYGGRADDILKYIPSVRNSALTPPEMSLQLIAGVENLDTTGDSWLAELVQRAKGADFNYVFKANLPGKDNAETAGELGDTINQLYQTALYREGQEFCAEIAYKEGSEYKLLE